MVRLDYDAKDASIDLSNNLLFLSFFLDLPDSENNFESKESCVASCLQDM
jgi:hypothetical protein